MKLLTTFALATMLSTAAYSTELSNEICATTGPCTINVIDNDSGEQVWITKEKDASAIGSTWITEGTLWVILDDEYNAISASLPASQKVILPALNPTTKQPMEKGGKGGTAAPAGGPLISGSITVTTTVGGGADSCKDCHTGSTAEIHKKVMRDKSK